VVTQTATQVFTMAAYASQYAWFWGDET
jgi:hypothetical protein